MLPSVYTSCSTSYIDGRYSLYKSTNSDNERALAQWLERGALPLSLPAVRFRIPLGGGFSEKYYVSPLSILGHYFDVVSLGKALNPQTLHLTQV